MKSKLTKATPKPLPDPPHMLLRDWFACHAVAGVITAGRAVVPEDIATVAYEIADAMVARRED